MEADNGPFSITTGCSDAELYNGRFRLVGIVEGAEDHDLKVIARVMSLDMAAILVKAILKSFMPSFMVIEEFDE